MIITDGELSPSQGAIPVSDGRSTHWLPAGPSGYVLTTDPTQPDGIKWAAGGSGSGTVTSVALTVPSWLSVSGTPITTSGTLAVTAASAQTANEFLATPNGSAGAVGLRAIAAADLPAGTLQTATYGATTTFALSSNLNDKWQVTLTGNPTLALSGGFVGQVFTILLNQDTSGSRTVTWFGTIRWAGGTAPTLTTTPSKSDLFVFECIAANTYLGSVAGQNY